MAALTLQRSRGDVHSARAEPKAAALHLTTHSLHAERAHTGGMGHGMWCLPLSKPFLPCFLATSDRERLHASSSIQQLHNTHLCPVVLDAHAWHQPQLVIPDPHHEHMGALRETNHACVQQQQTTMT